MTGACNGLRVIDLSQIIAGPYCAQQLALLGARVTKVEAPGGDPLRWRGGTDRARADAGMSTAFQAQARGRDSAVLDLASFAGRARLNAMLVDADVLIENFRTHVLPRQDLAPTTLLAAHPRLIMCSITGYGPGPCADWPAYDHTIQAASGLTMTTGTGPGPTRVGAPILDFATGLAASVAILAALRERDSSGRGQHVQVSMLDVALGLQGSFVTDHLLTGAVPRSRGNEAGSGEPLASIFKTNDGWIALAVNEPHQFSKLCRALGHAEWATDPRFRTIRARREHRVELRELVAARLATQSALELERALTAAGVAAARVRTLDKALTHPARTGAAAGVPPSFRLQRGQLDPSAIAAPVPPTSEMIATRNTLNA